jgi:aryl-alcohol dehydrogenase-like predicted oxidoreductase
MEKRKFGKSGLETSAIGFGGWEMGKGQYGPIDEKEAIAAAHRAIDLGVTLFDSAAVYGWGAGEEMMGRALKGRRDKVILVTKGGRVWNLKTDERRSDSSPEVLNKGLEESLRRLQTDYIDLFLIHWPDPTRPMGVPMGVFAKWKEQGKIRYGGVSNFSVQQMEDCLKVFPITCNQVGYNMFDRRTEAEVLPFCQKHGVGVMSYGSLSYGLLTGTMTSQTRFGEDDWRRSGKAFSLPIFEGEHFQKNLAVVEKLKKVARAKGVTLPQMAVAWVLSNPALTVALTGIRRPAEIEENVKGVGLKLTAQEKKEIDAAFEGSFAPYRQTPA